MYPETWTAPLPGLCRHDWSTYSGEESLEALARTTIDTCGIRDGDVIVGASLGGMVACEIARLRRLSAVYLVGSAVRPEEISPLLKTLHPLSRAVPFDSFRRAAARLPFELAQMFSRSDPRFVRAMCSAVFRWPGLATGADTKVYRLHGARDRVIRPPARSDLGLDGGHLISMTHAADCAEFVRQAEDRDAASAPGL